MHRVLRPDGMASLAGRCLHSLALRAASSLPAARARAMHPPGQAFSGSMLKTAIGKCP